MRTHARLTLLATIVACGLSGCSRSPAPPGGVSDGLETGVVTVYVVNYPLKYFSERIGGDRVAVRFPAPPDVDPAFWNPAAEDIARYQQADLILLNGADYARWIATVSLPHTKTVNTASGIREQLIQLEEAVTHRHGPDGEHAHGGTAFTTWLDPKLAIEQARAIAAALSERWPEHKQQFEANFSGLEKDLLDLDAALEESVAGARDEPLVFSHPVYQYLERRYGLNGRSVHWEPDETPTAEQWNELAEILKTHPAKWMIWEGEPQQETVERLREMGIESVVFDPCGNLPEDGDYLAVMQRNVSSLAQGLGTATPSAAGSRVDTNKESRHAEHSTNRPNT
jgi:zinc transport system substrate-binding protein